MQKGIDTVIAVCYIESVPRATPKQKRPKKQVGKKKKNMKNYEIERYSRNKGTGDHYKTITAETDERAVLETLIEYRSILQTERMISNDLRLNLYCDGEPVAALDGTTVYRYGDHGTYAVPLQSAYYDQSHNAFIAKAINSYGYAGYLTWDICDFDNPTKFEELEQI